MFMVQTIRRALATGCWSVGYLRTMLRGRLIRAPVGISAGFWARWWRCCAACTFSHSSAAPISSRRSQVARPSSSSSGTSSPHTWLWSRPPSLAYIPKWNEKICGINRTARHVSTPRAPYSLPIARITVSVLHVYLFYTKTEAEYLKFTFYIVYCIYLKIIGWSILDLYW